MRAGGKRRMVGALLLALGFNAIALPAPEVGAAPPGDDQVVAFLARGVGNGHGRGLSQWGAFGRAVNGGQTWQQILDAYYGGTTMGAGAEPNMRVQLTAWDNAMRLGVISASGQAQWNGHTYPALYAEEISPN